MLRASEGRVQDYSLFGSHEADVYSFGVIMQEIATSDEPYGAFDLDQAGPSYRRLCLGVDPSHRARHVLHSPSVLSSRPTVTFPAAEPSVDTTVDENVRSLLWSDCCQRLRQAAMVNAVPGRQGAVERKWGWLASAL